MEAPDTSLCIRRQTKPLLCAYLSGFKGMKKLHSSHAKKGSWGWVIEGYTLAA
jgi:hypothetical protein